MKLIGLLCSTIKLVGLQEALPILACLIWLHSLLYMRMCSSIISLRVHGAVPARRMHSHQLPVVHQANGSFLPLQMACTKSPEWHVLHHGFQ